MTFATETAKYSLEPIVLCKVELSGGDELLAKVDVDSTNSWDGYIQNFGSLTRSISFVNAAFRTSDITITCINSQNPPYFSQNFDNEKLLNRPVTLYVGTPDLAFTAFKTIYGGVISKYEYTPDFFKFTVVDKTDRYINNKDYATLIIDSDWANVDSSAVGNYMPIIYGDNDSSTGPCVGYLIDTVNNKYVFAGHAVKAIDAVYKRDSDGNVTLYSSGVTTDTAEAFDGDYIATATFTTDQSDYQIIADIQGVEGDGDGTGTLITNPVLQMEHFVKTWLSLPAGDLDSDAFDDAEAIADSRAYVGVGQINKGINGKEVIQQMAQTFNITAFHNNSGQLSVNMFESSLSSGYASAQVYSDQNDVFKKSFKLKPQFSQTANKVTILFDYDAGLDTYKQTYVWSDATAITDLLKTFEKTIKLPFTDSPIMAADIAQRYILVYKYPPVIASFNTSLLALNNDLSEVIKITHWAGLADATGYTDRIFQIQSIKPNLDGLSVNVSAVDVNAWITNAYILGDETSLAADWTIATDADKFYGYLCSEVTEEFSTGDPGKRLF